MSGAEGGVMRHALLWIVDRVDHGECRRCGAPPEDVHAECWRLVFDRLRDLLRADAAEDPS